MFYAEYCHDAVTELSNGYVEQLSHNTIRIRCHNGYVLRGPSTMYCDKYTQKWSYSKPNCECELNEHVN